MATMYNLFGNNSNNRLGLNWGNDPNNPLNSMANWGSSPIANYDLSSLYSGGNSALGLNPNASGIGMQAPNSGFWADYGKLLPNKDNINDPSVYENIKKFLGENKDAIGAGVDTMKTALGLYGTFQGLNLAKKQFNFTKQMAEKNLANQTKSYNTELDRRERLRLAASGMSQEEKDANVREYLDKNKL